MSNDITALAQAAEKYRSTFEAHRNNPSDASTVEAWDQATSEFMKLINNDEANIIALLLEKLRDAGECRDALFSAKRRIGSLLNELKELESRTVTVKLPADRDAESGISDYDGTEFYRSGWNARGKADREALAAVGINVEVE